MGQAVARLCRDFEPGGLNLVRDRLEILGVTPPLDSPVSVDFECGHDHSRTPGPSIPMVPIGQAPDRHLEARVDH
jgi:hypothetical protein